MMPGYALFRRQWSGFSFIELMITLAIMAVLVAVAVPLLQINMQRQKERELRTALTEIREALDAYKRASEQGRITLRIDESGYPSSLEQLVMGVEDERSPNRQKMYFLRRLPIDPMLPPPSDGKPAWGLRSYESPSDYPAEGEDVFDVYSLSDKVGLNGVPYRKW
ncbi:MAG: type II secretion system GspH family protein [Zoogloeaceae bacterium]|jgi:general secretion pathway protein G|nr:type II secretion system GspH family protein [Zoogloeaceae bacterium]